MCTKICHSSVMLLCNLRLSDLRYSHSMASTVYFLAYMKSNMWSNFYWVSEFSQWKCETNYGFFAPLPIRPLACSPAGSFAPGLFAPWLIRPLVKEPEVNKPGANEPGQKWFCTVSGKHPSNQSCGSSTASGL